MGRRPRMCVFCGKSVTKLTDHLQNVHKLTKCMSQLAKKYIFISTGTHVNCAVCNKLVALVKGSIESYRTHLVNWHPKTDIPIEDLIKCAKEQGQQRFPYQLFPVNFTPFDNHCQGKQNVNKTLFWPKSHIYIKRIFALHIIVSSHGNIYIVIEI